MLDFLALPCSTLSSPSRGLLAPDGLSVAALSLLLAWPSAMVPPLLLYHYKKQTAIGCVTRKTVAHQEWFWLGSAAEGSTAVRRLPVPAWARSCTGRVVGLGGVGLGRRLGRLDRSPRAGGRAGQATWGPGQPSALETHHFVRFQPHHYRHRLLGSA